MADAGSSKITNTRDRMTSQPSKNINWHAEIKPKPPPPPKPHSTDCGITKLANVVGADSSLA